MDPRLVSVRRHIRRRLSWHRRPIAGACAGLAVLLGFSAYRDVQRGVPMVVAAADLAAGRVLTAGDVSVVFVPAASRADGVLPDVAAALGHRLAFPMRRHEPMTGLRLLDGTLLTALGPGLRAVPLRLADGAAALIVQPGAVVDVYARTDAGTPGGAVARSLRVLSVTAADDRGALLVLAADDNAAARLAGAAGVGSLSIAVRAPP